MGKKGRNQIDLEEDRYSARQLYEMEQRQGRMNSGISHTSNYSGGRINNSNNGSFNQKNGQAQYNVNTKFVQLVVLYPLDESLTIYVLTDLYRPSNTHEGKYLPASEWQKRRKPVVAANVEGLEFLGEVYKIGSEGFDALLEATTVDQTGLMECLSVVETAKKDKQRAKFYARFVAIEAAALVGLLFLISRLIAA